jgi:O-antigen ligase
MTVSFRLFLLCSFVLLGRPQDFFPVLQPFRPALVLTILALVAAILASRREDISAAFATLESKRYWLFYLIMIVGIPFAYHRRIAFQAVFEIYSANMLFFFLLVSQVTSLQRLKSFIWIVCLCTLLYSIFGGILQGSGDIRLRVAGTMFDPNDTACLLVSLFPLCLYFVRFDEGMLKKLVAAAAICGAVATILLTGSRGGFLALGALMLIAFLNRSAGIGKGSKVIIVLMLVATGVVMGDRIDVERYLTLTDLSKDYNLSSPGGRLELWKAAIGLTFSNPLTGVGVDCFSWAHYLARVEIGDAYRRYHAVHNSYLQIASEIGLIGFAVFMLIIVQSLRTFSRISRIQSQSTSPETGEMCALGGYMHFGFVGLLVAAFFLSHGYSVLLTLYFGLAAVMARLQAVKPASGIQVTEGAADTPGRYEGNGIPVR